MKKLIVINIFLFLIVSLFAKKVTLSGDNLKKALAFQKLFKLASKNVIIDKSVKGNISFNLENVEFDTALKLLCLQAACKYEVVANIYVISSKITRSFDIQHDFMKKTEILYLNFTKVEDVIDMVRAAFGRIVKVSKYESMNALIVKGTESNILKVKEFVDKIDKKVKQVTIKLKIVETEHSYIKEFGFNWNLYKKNSKKLFKNKFRKGIFKNYIKSFRGNAYDYSSFASEEKKLDSIVSLLNRDKKLKSVSYQNMLCLNNEESLIDTGTVIYYTEKNLKISLSKKLLVKPRILGNNIILVSLRPSFKTNGREIKERYVAKQNVLRTEVRVKAGEETLIGYFVNKSNSKDKESKFDLKNVFNGFIDTQIGRINSDGTTAVMIFLTAEIL